VLQRSPEHAEFSFVIPMTLERDESAFAIAILIERADACTVACAMFGVVEHEVPEDDLRDACSEVCNIFADCISTHSYGAEVVQIGLPFRLSATHYHHVFNASGHKELFESCHQGHRLRVMLFTPSPAP
jgi:hypothetical protein